MSEEEITLSKYMSCIRKGYCGDCNELNCIDNFPQVKIVNAIEKLQQENKQLKEENERYRKLGFKYLNEQNNQLKEVIEEVREYIDNNTEFEHDGDEYGYTEWVNIKPQNIVFIDELLQILDKGVKDEK